MSHSLPSVAECARMYLAPPMDTYWRWSPDGNAVEWIANGTTILLREELLAYVQHRCDGHQGLPPMQALVLLAATLRDRIRTAAKLHLMQLPEFDSLRHVLREHPTAKLLLYDHMLQRQRHASAAFAANVLRALAAPLPSELLARRETQKLDLKTLADDLAMMRLTMDDERLMRSALLGAEQLPDATELTPSPAASPELGDSDGELQAFAGLVRGVLTAFRLPRTLHDASDYASLGGIAGLTNRGDLDRLAFAELAHDDETLAVRIASKEAIYVDREPPPAPPSVHRRILVDTGIRMWGTPRVLATAIATALVRQADAATDGAPTASKRPAVQVTCFRSERARLTKIDLRDRDQLLAQLRHLDTRLDCREALPEFLQESGSAAAKTPAEDIVIGHQLTIHDPGIQVLLRSRGATRRFAFDVAANGHVRLWQVGPRGCKLLREAVLTTDVAAPATPQKESASTAPGHSIPGYALAVEQLASTAKTRPMAATELLVGPQVIGITTRRGIHLGIGASHRGSAALQRLRHRFRRYPLVPHFEPQWPQARPPTNATKAPIVEIRFRGHSDGIHAAWDGYRMLFATTPADASEGSTPILAVSIRAHGGCVGYCFDSGHTLRGERLVARLATLAEMAFRDDSLVEDHSVDG
ncbi:MAG: hypothetical protein AB8H80_03170 [Planctomycetota bacterium]